MYNTTGTDTIVFERIEKLLQHMEDMLRHTMAWKKLSFRGVLMDTWYATNHLMQVIDSLGKYFYCPILPPDIIFIIPEAWDGSEV